MKEKELLYPLGIWPNKGMDMTAEVEAFAELRMTAKVKPTVIDKSAIRIS